MNYYIADLHFSHQNIIQFDKRPYQTIEQMNNDLVKRWNDVITDRDDVYVLGDMFWNTDDAPMILQMLKGHIHLIKGNHDKITSDMMHYFSSISGYAEINDNGNNLILCHYPIMFYNHSLSRSALTWAYFIWFWLYASLMFASASSILACVILLAASVFSFM